MAVLPSPLNSCARRHCRWAAVPIENRCRSSGPPQGRSSSPVTGTAGDAWPTRCSPGMKQPCPARSLGHRGVGVFARVGTEALGASLSAEVVRVALVINGRGGRGWVHAHTANRIHRLGGVLRHVVLLLLIASDLHHRGGGWYADVVGSGCDPCGRRVVSDPYRFDASASWPSPARSPPHPPP